MRKVLFGMAAIAGPGSPDLPIRREAIPQLGLSPEESVPPCPGTR